jgi:hypothetical protein
MIRALHLTVLTLSLMAATAEAKEPSLAKSCPNLTKTERAEVLAAEKPGAPGFRENASYARAYCVSLTEAKRRMEIQSRDAIGAETEPGGPPPPPENSVGVISAKVEVGEKATFAGLWYQHQPVYGVVVAFTRDAAATLKKYTNDPLFIPLDRPGPTHAELYETQKHLSQELERLGAHPVSAGSSITTGRVEFDVTGDLTAFHAAVARGEVKLPSYVDIREPAPLKIAVPPLPAAAQNPVKAFPRVKLRSGGMELDILRMGVITLKNGCLRTTGDDETPSYVIVWPNEAALDLVSVKGKVQILNRLSGERVTVDERMIFGGNAGLLGDDSLVIDTSPACPGPYYSMGNFGNYAKIEESQLANRAAELAQEKRLSRAAAMKLAREEVARVKRFQALASELQQRAPESFVSMSVGGGKATIKFSKDPAGEAKRLIPPDLLPFVTAEVGPVPLAVLKAARTKLARQLAAVGLKAALGVEADRGRINLQSEQLPEIGAAARAGKVQIPDFTVVQSNGGFPVGGYSAEGMQAANRAAEAVPDFAELRALVDATLLPGFLVTYKEGEPDRSPTKAQSLDITRYLAQMGYSARDIRALRAQGQDPVVAFVKQNGFSTPENRALLTQEVVIAEIVDVDTKALLGDGKRTTVRLKVVEGLKGDLKPGEEAQMRLISGFDPDGKFQQTYDEPVVIEGLPAGLAKGSRWMFHLSEGAYAHGALLARSQVAAPAGSLRIFGLANTAFPVTGGGFGMIYVEQSPGTLSEIRAKLGPVDRAWDAATKANGAPLMRRKVR